MAQSVKVWDGSVWHDLDGEDGKTPNVDATASVTWSASGTTDCVVTKTGTAENANFDFAFELDPPATGGDFEIASGGSESAPSTPVEGDPKTGFYTIDGLPGSFFITCEDHARLAITGSSTSINSMKSGNTASITLEGDKGDVHGSSTGRTYFDSNGKFEALSSSDINLDADGVVTIGCGASKFVTIYHDNTKRLDISASNARLYGGHQDCVIEIGLDDILLRADNSIVSRVNSLDVVMCDLNRSTLTYNKTNQSAYCDLSANKAKLFTESGHGYTVHNGTVWINGGLDSSNVCFQANSGETFVAGPLGETSTGLKLNTTSASLYQGGSTGNYLDIKSGSATLKTTGGLLLNNTGGLTYVTSGAFEGQSSSVNMMSTGNFVIAANGNNQNQGLTVIHDQANGIKTVRLETKDGHTRLFGLSPAVRLNLDGEGIDLDVPPASLPGGNAQKLLLTTATASIWHDKLANGTAQFEVTSGRTRLTTPVGTSTCTLNANGVTLLAGAGESAEVRRGAYGFTVNSTDTQIKGATTNLSGNAVSINSLALSLAIGSAQDTNITASRNINLAGQKWPMATGRTGEALKCLDSAGTLGWGMVFARVTRAEYDELDRNGEVSDQTLYIIKG